MKNPSTFITAWGTVRTILDANQNVENSYDFEGFGTEISTSENIYNRYRYTGREIDVETESANSEALYYYRARTYDSTIGAFTSCDPIPALNLYSYCSANPITHFDPLGKYDLSAVYNKLSKQNQAKLRELIGAGWRFAEQNMNENGSDNDNPYRVHRRSDVTSDDGIDVDVTERHWKALEALGQDVDWREDEWGIFYDEKLFYLDYGSEETAARVLAELINRAMEKKHKDSYEGSVDFNKLNCLGYAMRLSGATTMDEGASVSSFITSRGWTCKKGISAESCAKQNKDNKDCDYMMVYIVVTDGNVDDAYDIEDDINMSGLDVFDSSWGEVDRASGGRIDYHALRGHSNGVYTEHYGRENKKSRNRPGIDIERFVGEERFSENQMLGQMCCTKCNK